MEDNYKVSVNVVHSPNHLVTNGIYCFCKDYLDIFGLPLKGYEAHCITYQNNKPSGICKQIILHVFAELTKLLHCVLAKCFFSCVCFLFVCVDVITSSHQLEILKKIETIFTQKLHLTIYYK